MKSFLRWGLVIVFLSGLFFLVFLIENNSNKQTYQQITPTIPQEKVVSNATQANIIQYVKLAGVQVKVELATTPEAKMNGLSGQSGLATNTGMLFVFYMPGKYAFWMKDMKFPIDIIWIRNDNEVVYIKKNLAPDTYPTTFQPEEDVTYVLEVPAGFSDQNNLKVGDKAVFEY